MPTVFSPNAGVMSVFGPSLRLTYPMMPGIGPGLRGPGMLNFSGDVYDLSIADTVPNLAGGQNFAPSYVTPWVPVTSMDSPLMGTFAPPESNNPPFNSSDFAYAGYN